VVGEFSELQGARRQLRVVHAASGVPGSARDAGFPLGTASGLFSGRPGWRRAARRVAVAVMTAPFRRGS